MINLSTEEKERCKSDLSFLKKVLNRELENARDHLEAVPVEKAPLFQGRAKALRDIINLLT